MAIAQMNWGRMKFAPDDPRLSEFMGALARVYAQAEAHPGFIWRIPDDNAAQELAVLGHDDRVSATVSVWRGVDDLRDYTFNTEHGAFLKRTAEWFEAVEGPQLVIWDVDPLTKPGFGEAFERLQRLRENGDSAVAYGWPGT